MLPGTTTARINVAPFIMATYTTQRRTQSLTPSPLTLKLSTRYTPLSRTTSSPTIYTPSSCVLSTPSTPWTSPPAVPHGQELSPAALALLSVLSLLLPTRIPESFFLDAMNVFAHAAPAHDDFPRNSQSYVAARSELVRAGWVRRVRAKGELLVDRDSMEGVRQALRMDEMESALCIALAFRAAADPSQGDRVGVWGVDAKKRY